MKHPSKRNVIVPIHAKKDLKLGVLRAILRDADLTANDLLNR